MFVRLDVTAMTISHSSFMKQYTKHIKALIVTKLRYNLAALLFLAGDCLQ